MNPSSSQKLVSPSSLRNCVPIGNRLANILPMDARILEIASGTGQHGAHMCAQRPDVIWQYSDIDGGFMASQKAYAQDFPPRLLLPLYVDVMKNEWWQELEAVDALYCANMIHIAPWDAALGLARGAGKLLPKHGILCLYGPFLMGGASVPSNLAFDVSLKSRNSAWGVRTLESVKHIFADAGLNLTQAIDMPRDNSLLVFQKYS